MIYIVVVRKIIKNIYYFKSTKVINFLKIHSKIKSMYKYDLAIFVFNIINKPLSNRKCLTKIYSTFNYILFINYLF